MPCAALCLRAARSMTAVRKEVTRGSRGPSSTWKSNRKRLGLQAGRIRHDDSSLGAVRAVVRMSAGARGTHSLWPRLAKGRGHSLPEAPEASHGSHQQVLPEVRRGQMVLSPLNAAQQGLCHLQQVAARQDALFHGVLW